MRAHGVVTGLIAGAACVLSPLALSGCGEDQGGGSGSAGGVAGTNETGSGGGSTGTGGRGGISIETGGLGGASTASGGSESGAAEECSCPTGGDPYSVLVQGASGESVLPMNAETPASAAFACGDWLSGPLRGKVASGCSGKYVTFAACQGADASPPCVLVDGGAVTYVDDTGLEWLGRIGDLNPSAQPTLVDPLRQEGSFTVQVTRDGVSQDLSVFYVLCGPGPRGLVPC